MSTINKKQANKQRKQPKNKKKQSNAQKMPGFRKVNAPVAKGTRTRVNSKDMTIRHREMFAELVGPQGDENVMYRNFFIQPGLPNMFPWLSGIAPFFEHYRFKRIKISFIPSIGTQNPGVVYMGVDYDVLDANHDTVLKIANNQGVVSGPVWSTVNLNVEVNNSQFRKLTSRTSIIPNSDQKTYDLGKLEFLFAHSNTSGSIGQLYVDYEVELLVPQVGENFLTNMSTANGSAVNKDNIIGTSTVNKIGSANIESIKDLAGNIIKGAAMIKLGKPGDYIFDQQLRFNSTNAFSAPASVGQDKSTNVLLEQIFSQTTQKTDDSVSYGAFKVKVLDDNKPSWFDVRQHYSELFLLAEPEDVVGQISYSIIQSLSSV
jgi:hypothetical protein